MVSSNAKRAPGFAFALAALGVSALYIPLLYLVWNSFLSRPDGSFTIIWYQKVLQNEQILSTVKNSLIVASFSTLISCVIGTAAALALVRVKFMGRKVLDAIVHMPLVMPEIVMGLSLLVWFVFLNLTLGMVSVILAHVTFSLSYVIITVKTRLAGFDRSLEEAARDLGATPFQVFWRITFPLIRPGIMSGALIAFTLSFDDFLITFFTAGVGSDTLPLKIYGMIKYGINPEINALSSILLGATLTLVLIFFRPESNQHKLKGSL